MTPSGAFILGVYATIVVGAIVRLVLNKVKSTPAPSPAPSTRTDAERLFQLYLLVAFRRDFKIESAQWKEGWGLTLQPSGVGGIPSAGVTDSLRDALDKLYAAEESANAKPSYYQTVDEPRTTP